MATISLNEFILEKKTARANVGDTLVYAGKIHASVGFDLDYQIADMAIVAYQNFETRYHNPENMKKGWTGGDSATGTYSFAAKKAGKTILRLIHLYRGQVEAQYDIEIIVQ